MDEDVKKVLEFILHERMKTKADLELFRFLDQNDFKRSYKREIDERLDRMNFLNEWYEKLKNK
jgi:hypothetical protein